MSDAVYAKSIIDEIWPLKVHGRGPVITATYRAIKDPAIAQGRKP